ncbi:MAG: c-type cytochrome [Candidatus Sericytochromatia bacterium]|jgi:cytochrome c2|nr:c-type cytochrome [Candidatus Sericytochromatia bacterium]
MSAHEEHPSHVPVYIKLAAALGIVTAVEVAILMMPLPNAAMYVGMYSLAAVKFGFVVAIFMHLKYDNKLLTGIFFSGFTIALATMVAMVSLINYQPTKTSINVKDTKELAALSTGNAENGPAVFKAKGCSACHVVSSVEGAVGQVGPKLDGLSERAKTRVAGKDAMAYIRESIENPGAYVVEKYPAGLMPANLRQTMSDQEYNDLVAFLAKL